MVESAWPGLYKVTLNGEIHGQRCQNGFWFTDVEGHGNMPDNATSATNLLVNFMAQIYPKIREFQNQEYHYISGTCATIYPTEGPIAEQIIETGNGLQPNESLPSYCAAILSLRTGFGGKSRRGRCFFSGIAEEDSDQSRLTALGLGRLQGIGNELLARFGQLNSNRGWNYGVFSKKLARGPVLTNFSWSAAEVERGFFPITQVIARHILGTENHRKIGHGG